MKKKSKEFDQEEFDLMEKQLLKDIAILIHKASETILESKILDAFYKKLNKQRPTNDQISTLKRSLYGCVINKFPKFGDAIELVVERDVDNDRVVVIEFKPKKIKIKKDD